MITAQCLSPISVPPVALTWLVRIVIVRIVIVIVRIVIVRIVMINVWFVRLCRLSFLKGLNACQLSTDPMTTHPKYHLIIHGIA